MLGAVVISSDTLTPMVVSIAKQHGVDPDLIKGIIKQESNWDVNASRYEAHKGDSSWGLMQVLLNTAKGTLGDNNLTISQLISPETNVTAGTKYFAYQLSRYGNIRDAIAAYNAGSVRKTKDGKYVNQSYVDSVYRNYMMYRTIGAAVTPEVASIGIGAFALLGLGLVLAQRN